MSSFADDHEFVAFCVMMGFIAFAAFALLVYMFASWLHDRQIQKKTIDSIVAAMKAASEEETNTREKQ